MRNRRAATSLALLALAATAASGAPGKPRPPAPPVPVATPVPEMSVSVAGVEVVSAGFGEKGKEAQPFGDPPGTRLALVVRAAPPFVIVSLDAGKSVLDEMRDGAGQVLAAPRLLASGAVSDDGQAAVFEVRSGGVPGSRAASVSVLGKLALKVAGGVRTLRAPSVKLRKGATFQLERARVTVADVEPGAETTVTLDGPALLLDGLKAVRFSAGGTTVRAERRERREPPEGAPSAGRASVTYRAALRAATVAVEAELWQDVRSLDLPFAVQSGVALDQASAATVTPPPPPALSDMPVLGLTLVGVKVVGPGAGGDGGAPRPFDQEEGSALSIVLSVPPPFGIISVEGEAVEMQDSGGKRFAEPQFVQVRRLADNTVAVVDLAARGRPDAGAESVRAQGVLSVVASTGVQTTKVPNVMLVPGDTFRLAGQVITIREVLTSPRELRFTMEGPSAALDVVKALRFRPRSQPLVIGEERGRRSGEATAERSYRVATTEVAGAFEIDLWLKPRTLRVPFDVRATLGLPPVPAGLSSPHSK